MSKKSEFQRFLPFFWKMMKSRYDFLSRFETALCVAIPKSSSFYCGVSPTYGKHVVFDLQHCAKPWEAGEFYINVHISQDLAPTESWIVPESRYAEFGEGYYRLPLCVGDKDISWCLKPRDRGCSSRRRDPFQEFREPSDYSDPDAVLAETAESVRSFLHTHLFRKAGFCGE